MNVRRLCAQRRGCGFVVLLLPLDECISIRIRCRARSKCSIRSAMPRLGKQLSADAISEPKYSPPPRHPGSLTVASSVSPRRRQYMQVRSTPRQSSQQRPRDPRKQTRLGQSPRRPRHRRLSRQRPLPRRSRTENRDRNPPEGRSESQCRSEREEIKRRLGRLRSRNRIQGALSFGLFGTPLDSLTTRKHAHRSCSEMPRSVKP